MTMAFKTNSSASGLFTGNIRAQLTPGHQLPRITAEQMMVLEANFKQNRNPNDLEITFIAAEAGMAETDVRVGICVRVGIYPGVYMFPSGNMSCSHLGT